MKKDRKSRRVDIARQLLLAARQAAAEGNLKAAAADAQTAADMLREESRIDDETQAGLTF